MGTSPNADAIHVGDRMKQLREIPSVFCIEGIIWMALEPFPMTPTRLPLKS